MVLAFQGLASKAILSFSRHDIESLAFQGVASKANTESEQAFHRGFAARRLGEESKYLILAGISYWLWCFKAWRAKRILNICRRFIMMLAFHGLASKTSTLICSRHFIMIWAFQRLAGRASIEV